jgi:TRAP-type C4-dicarboxylate transport system substrate-binding protein
MLGKIFITWRRAFARKLDGRFELEVIYGDREREETTVAQALLSDRLDGALLTIAGLRAIHADFGLLTIPGWIDSCEALEGARGELGSHLDARFDARGLKRVAWYDVGLVRLMSRGVPLDDPKQLVDRGAWTSPVVGVAGLFGTKTVDWTADFQASKVTIAPMTERSWSYHDRVHAIPVLAAGGALVVRKRALECMPAEAQTVWAETVVEVVRFFRRPSEREQELFEKAPRSYLSLVQPANAGAARWREAVRREGEEYMRGFPPELVERVRRTVGNGATHVSTFTGDP